MTKDARTELHKILFSNLVMMLSSSAMQQLGKIVNPMTGKSEVSLEGAQVTIDMLEMLSTKTQGNLDDEEARLLADILSSLQMNYVETAKSAPQQAPPDTPAEPREAASPEQQATADPTPDEPQTDAKPKEGHDPKYHKSYGS